MLNTEKTLVLYVLRLGRFVSSMSWCLESALRRCELRHSVTLKAELRRSIEVVLSGHHFVADLSTWFREVTDLSAASFCFDDQSGGILVLLKKKKKKLRLSRSLPFFRSTMLSNYAPFFLEKKKKDRGRIFQQRGREIYARSGKNLLACILSHPSRSETVKDVLFIRRKESTCAKQEVVIQQMTDRRGVFFWLHVTPPLWGCGAPSLGWGNFPSWRDFPFELTNQSAFIFTGPQAQIPSSPYQQGLGLVRG